MNKATARYWRQVHAVQHMTGSSSAVARSVVRTLREVRGYETAAETKRHPIIVKREVDAEQPPEEKGKPYKDLDDWIDSFDAWEGDYEYYDIETNADY